MGARCGSTQIMQAQSYPQLESLCFALFGVKISVMCAVRQKEKSGSCCRWWVKLSCGNTMYHTFCMSLRAASLHPLTTHMHGCAGIPEGVDAFQGNSSVLQQLSTTATSLDHAQAQAISAEALLASSQAAAAQAQAAIEEAVSEAAAAEQQLALKTPAALARAQGMVPVLEPMVAAAEIALPYVTDGLGTTLRALVTLVERNSAARDLAPVVRAVSMQHARCLKVLQRLHDIGAAAAAGLSGAVQGMQAWQQQHQGMQFEQQGVGMVLAGGVNPARDAHLLQLLLTGLQPALAGVKEELGELGQVSLVTMCCGG